MPGSQNIISPFNFIKWKPFWDLFAVTIILIGFGYSFGLFLFQSDNFIKAYHYSNIPEITLPFTCDFSDSNQSNPHKYQGWSDSEKWGSWSKESNAILVFRFHESWQGKHIKLSLQFHHFYVNEQNKKIKTDVCINGSFIDTWIFEQRAGLTKELKILLGPQDKTLEIAFAIDGILSPAKAFGFPDKRELGIGISKIFIQEIDTIL